MRIEPFQVLANADRPFYPADGRCPVCGNDFLSGFAYLDAGALLLSEDRQDSLDTDRFQAFLNVGFRGTDPEMRDSADVAVIDNLHGGQFDLKWCSVACMRSWLLTLLAEVERRVQLGGVGEEGRA